MRCPLRAVFALLLAVVCGVAAESASPVPVGAADFAGRLARDHWHLFGDAGRGELEQLNRDLREALQLAQAAPSGEPRTAEERRASAAAQRLAERVGRHPEVVRLDLSAPRPAFAVHGPLQLPGGTGALLFEIKTAGDGQRFSVASRDLAEMPRGNSATLVILEAGATGTTHALAGLENLPVGRSTLLIEIRRPNHGHVRLPLDVVTPPPGRLKLTVLSDDTGEPVPAMVRLTWKTDGRPRPPANAIDFAPQFDSNGVVKAERTAFLPGTRKGSFWCAPEPVDMTLFPGEWEIAVGRGFEHTVMFERVTIRSGETLEKTIRPKRWVAMRERGWWSGDDHVHARITSERDAANILAWARAEDVHVTNVLHMGDVFRTYFEQRGFGPQHRVQSGDYVLVPAQECPRTGQIGHVLTMNTTSLVRDSQQYFLYDVALDGVHAQGGLTGYAHAATGMFEAHRDMTLNVPRGKIDFFEIHQFNNLGTDLYYEFLNLGCKVTASAGSDLPWGGTIGETRIYSYLGRDTFSADGWFAAVKRGRTFVTSGPMIELTVDEALPGDELRVTASRPLRVRARAWSDPALGETVRLEIVRHGDVIHASESQDQRRPEANAEFTVDAANGFWIAARARTSTGTSAHTTPIYVVREGLRFWKHAALDDLFAKRLASLAQIEELVADTVRQEKEGRLIADLNRKQLATDGPKLLERVAAARQLFADWREIAGAERSRRGAASPALAANPPGWELVVEQNFPVANEFSRWRKEGSAELATTMERTLQIRTKRGYVEGTPSSASTVWFDQATVGDTRIEFDAAAEAGTGGVFFFNARAADGRSIFEDSRPLARREDYAANDRLELYALDILRTGEKNVALRRLGGQASVTVFRQMNALPEGSAERARLGERFDALTVLQRAPSPFTVPEREHHWDVRVVGPRVSVIVDGRTVIDVEDPAAKDRPLSGGFFGFRNTRPSQLAVDSVRVFRRAGSSEPRPVIWKIDGTSVADAPAPTILGAPRVVVEEGRKALRFNGVSDGLVFPQNPVEGRRAFTIEVLFKPDGDGPPAQRFVHVEDAALNRGLIETRITPERRWYLDTFLFAPPKEPGLTLVDRNRLHPCDRWYWAALVYDGRTMSHYVDGAKELEGKIEFGPMGAGRTSLGVRLNQVFWFKGAIAEVRFHPHALAPTELQRTK